MVMFVFPFPAIGNIRCIERFSPKYPKAMDCLAKDKASMLAFYDYPAENWQHIRTTNPVESVFATVRLRTTKTKNCGIRRKPSNNAGYGI